MDLLLPRIGWGSIAEAAPKSLGLQLHTGEILRVVDDFQLEMSHTAP